MFQPLDCISLRLVRHSDRAAILTVYTRQAGRVSMLVPDGAGRGVKRLRALTAPGARFTCMATARNGEKLWRPGDIMPLGTPLFPDDPAKPAVVLFIADILCNALREQQPEPLLYDFISSMLELLATGRVRTADFHIIFLLRLAHFLGIEPDMASWNKGYIFDMEGGVFTAVPSGHGNYLEAREAAFLKQLWRMTPRNSHLFGLSGTTRATIIDVMLRYYIMHGALQGMPRSLDILRTLF